MPNARARIAPATPIYETDNPNLPTRVVAVLGMHRSGTSCVTGSLQNYGLFLGEHSTWNRHNTKGNRENQSIVNLNDKVLEANGGNWLEPPTNVIWSEEHLAEARDILGQYKDQALFGFKDPRTLITLDGWLSILGKRLNFVGIYRNPNSVVHSIQSRGEVDREIALKAWQIYNQCLIRTRKLSRFPMLCFDWPDEKLQRKLAKTATRLGLERTSDDHFFTPDLKHHDMINLEVPEESQHLLSELEAYTRFPRQWL